MAWMVKVSGWKCNVVGAGGSPGHSMVSAMLQLAVQVFYCVSVVSSQIYIYYYNSADCL